MGKEIQIDNLEDMCKLMCDNELPKKIYKYCLRCGRKLKNPEARIRGFGMVCYNKMKQEKQKRRLF